VRQRPTPRANAPYSARKPPSAPEVVATATPRTTSVEKQAVTLSPPDRRPSRRTMPPRHPAAPSDDADAPGTEPDPSPAIRPAYPATRAKAPLPVADPAVAPEVRRPHFIRTLPPPPHPTALRRRHRLTIPSIRSQSWQTRTASKTTPSRSQPPAPQTGCTRQYIAPPQR